MKDVSTLLEQRYRAEVVAAVPYESVELVPSDDGGPLMPEPGGPIEPVKPAKRRILARR